VRRIKRVGFISESDQGCTTLIERACLSRNTQLLTYQSLPSAQDNYANNERNDERQYSTDFLEHIGIERRHEGSQTIQQKE